MDAAEDEILGFDHMQVTAPRAEEGRAKAFYGGVLGLREIPKPAVLGGRGGAWYACGDKQLHLGLEDDFRPQRKGHPAFLVGDLARMRTRLEAAGAPISRDVQIPGFERLETRDPFGNRLEFMMRTDRKSEVVSAEAESEAIKARVRDVFSRTAEAYVTSPGHATGGDLDRVVALAAPHQQDRALDVSTGGGHTALALAPHVGHMTASDLTPAMLAAARAFITGRGHANVDFVIADAERLPFLDASFDLVTVRIAPHHYADIQSAVREMARVLVPGGRLVLVDNIAPEDDVLDRHLNEWEKRRDSSHVRAYKASEWHELLAAAGLRVTDAETGRKSHDFAAWTDRMQMPTAEREALETDILAAPVQVRTHFEVNEREGHVMSWSADFLTARAVK